jgi:glycosyltransferase involved in cell wall biosynthesis
MDTQLPPAVAVLLATYNGDQFVEAQIRSLKNNYTQFTLHWIDDQSTDNTRDTVRAAAISTGISLKEWHDDRRRGVPGTFFHLMECIDADIYLFCDQDDVWQPGKIDATVVNLATDITEPVLCFSDPWVFTGDDPKPQYRLSHVTGIRAPRALEEARALICTPAWGHTIGFTRRLRDIFIAHKDIAHTHACGHDWWMYLLALSCGTCRLLSDVPTSLYRRHADNVSTFTFRSKRSPRIRFPRSLQQRLRRLVSRQAVGFVLASETLPPGPKRERLVDLARLVARFDRRQSPADLGRLIRRGAMWPIRTQALSLAATCLSSNAYS